MYDDLKDLYQEVILDHSKSPRNCTKLPHYNHCAEGDNPICGDQLVIYVHLDDQQKINDISFVGNGCAISTASASMMTDLMKGKNLSEFQTFFNHFHALCTGQEEPDSAERITDDERVKLDVLSGVKQFPMRVKCATLAWHTLKAALENKALVSTEKENQL